MPKHKYRHFFHVYITFKSWDAGGAAVYPFPGKLSKTSQTTLGIARVDRPIILTVTVHFEDVVLN